MILKGDEYLAGWQVELGTCPVSSPSWKDSSAAWSPFSQRVPWRIKLHSSNLLPLLLNFHPFSRFSLSVLPVFTPKLHCLHSTLFLVYILGEDANSDPPRAYQTFSRKLEERASWWENTKQQTWWVWSNHRNCGASMWRTRNSCSDGFRKGLNQITEALSGFSSPEARCHVHEVACCPTKSVSVPCRLNNLDSTRRPSNFKLAPNMPLQIRLFSFAMKKLRSPAHSS